MEKRFYNAASIERILLAFERGYSMSSSDFFRAHEVNGPEIERIPSVHRQAWAGFYSTWLDLSDSGFAARVEQELELA
jgi:hypothetical protein